MSWRVVASNLDTANRFQVLLDDDRKIQVMPELVRRLHEAEPDSPLADGAWMGRG